MTLRREVPAERLQFSHRQLLVRDYAAVGPVSNPGESVLHLKNVVRKPFEVGRVAHFTGTVAGPARRPEMRPVGRKRPQFLRSTVQHDDHPGGEARGPLNQVELLFLLLLDLPKNEDGFRLNSPDGVG